MEKHFILLLVCLLVHVTNITADTEVIPKCGTNETYLEDPELPPCESTCSNPALACVWGKWGGWKGCRCLPGHVRDKSGNCVLLKDCPTAVGDCGKNEFYSNHAQKCSSCDGTCRVQNGGCIMMCRKGCYCEFHHVRNEQGICIPLNECSKS